MAEEESFVILGSCSPQNSLNSITESNQNGDSQEKKEKSVTQQAVHGQPTLTNGQFNSISKALASATKSIESSINSEHSIWTKSIEGTKANEISLSLDRSATIWKRSDESMYTSTVSNKENSLQQDNVSVKDYVKTGAIPKTGTNDSLKNGSQINESAPNSLAASFIMGQIPADTLKTSIHSQFPSVSLEDCEGLTTFMSDYLKMKDLIMQVNSRMSTWIEMKNQMQSNNTENRQKLEQCQEQIVALRNENLELKRELDTKIRQLQDYDAVRKLEHDDVIKNISEKTALIANMRAQIEKLELQQLASFEVVAKAGQDEKAPVVSEYVTRLEHNRIVKDFERNMSQLLAEKLEISDMQKQYIDEINCLKSNLNASEDSVKQLQSDIALFKASDKEKVTQFEVYARERDEMREELGILRQQVDVYSRDFQLERTAREEMAGEKAQFLDDLRLLQRKNQELTEQVERLEQRLAAITSQRQSPPAPTAKRTTPPTTAPAPVADHVCPVCSIGCKSLITLQEHVNQCLDRNVHS